MPEFLLGVPKSIHLAHLKRERDSGDEWTDAAACVSLLLDVDKGAVNDHMHYSRQWKWNRISRGKKKGQRSDEAGRSRVRRKWPELAATVLGWITKEGTFWKNPLLRGVPDDWWEYVEYQRPENDQRTTGERPENDREIPDSSESRGENDRSSTALRPPNDRLTKQPSHPSSPSLKTPSPARARSDAFDPVEEFNQTYAALPEQHQWHGFRLGIMQQPKIQRAVTDAGAWSETLRVWAESEYSPRNLDNLLSKYRGIVSAGAEPAPRADAGDAGGAGSEVPALRRASGEDGQAPRSARRSATGLRGTPEHRKTASDRRSEYGFDDAKRDVDAALADLIAADEARRSRAADGGGHDG